MHLHIIIIPPFHPTSLDHLQVHTPLIYPIQKLTNGAPHPPSVNSIILVSPTRPSHIHWGTHFCICTFNPIILYSFGNCIKYPFIFNNFIDVFHHSRWCFFLGTQQPMSPLVGAFHFHHHIYKATLIMAKISTITDTLVPNSIF
jgi:hypothetical protein